MSFRIWGKQHWKDKEYYPEQLEASEEAIELARNFLDNFDEDENME